MSHFLQLVKHLELYVLIVIELLWITHHVYIYTSMTSDKKMRLAELKSDNESEKNPRYKQACKKPITYGPRAIFIFYNCPKLKGKHCLRLPIPTNRNYSCLSKIQLIFDICIGNGCPALYARYRYVFFIKVGIKAKHECIWWK